MVCENCGCHIDASAAICGNCGAPLSYTGPPQYAAPAHAWLPYIHTRQRPRQQEDVSVGAWLISILVSYIPIVGLIMMFVWAFDSSTPPTKRNFFRAALILVAAYVVFIILLVVFNYRHYYTISK